MKKGVQIMVLAIALVGATGCGSQGVKPVENSVAVAPVVTEQKSVIETTKKDEIKMIPYTSKNGVVRFLYPEITYEPGQNPLVSKKVQVVEQGDWIYVFGDGYGTLKPSEKAILKIVSKRGIEQKDVSTFVAKVVGDKDCKVEFSNDHYDPFILSVAMESVLSDNEKDCTAAPLSGLYDAKQKMLFLSSSPKVGDFFFDGNEGAEQDGSTKSLQEKVFESVDFGSSTYNDEKHGFSLFFPATWQGYTVSDRELQWGDFGKSDSKDFGFGDQNPIFNIAIHTKDQWKKISADQDKESIHTQTYLGENKNYIFSYAPTGDVANDEMYKRLTEVASIIKTFQVE